MGSEELEESYREKLIKVYSDVIQIFLIYIAVFSVIISKSCFKTIAFIYFIFLKLR